MNTDSQTTVPSGQAVTNPTVTQDITAPQTTGTATQQTHVESQQSSNETPTTSQSTPDASTITQDEVAKKSDNDFRALAGKVSQLEKERNEYSKKTSENEKSRYANYLSIAKTSTGEAALNEHFMSNPQDYEWLRQYHKSQTGADIGEFSQVYGSPNGQPAIVENQKQAIAPENIEKTVREVVEKTREEERVKNEEKQRNEEAMGYFVQNVPEMEQKYKEDPEGAMKLFINAWDIGKELLQRFPDQFPSHKEALVHAYRTLPQNMSKQLEDAKRTGEVIGKSQALATAAGAVVPPQGSATNSTGDSTPDLSRLTKEQRRYYDLSVTKHGKKFADSFARNAIK